MPVSREEELSLLNPAGYHAKGYPWQVWDKLRAQDPIRWIDRGPGESYWAVTRYKDILDIESNTAVFKNAPRSVMRASQSSELHMIVAMDPPEHSAHRALANPFFMPRSIAWVRELVEQIVTEALDDLVERNGEVIDIQDDFANLVPTAVVAAYLGTPRESWTRILDCTNQIINAEDPAVNKGRDPVQIMREGTNEVFAITAATFADRRANPREDLVSALVQAEINGRKLNENELLSWAFILITAGHETTQGAFGTGLHALLQHPDQLAKLKARPELLPLAIEEMLRWSSPAIHFVRTAETDIEIAGRRIRSGDHLVMFYPSANRDEVMFIDPYVFDIERQPNRHIAFGCGPHQCIGMHLARLELRVMFSQFLKRVESVEVIDKPENVFTNNTGGFKHFPARLRLLEAVRL